MIQTMWTPRIIAVGRLGSIPITIANVAVFKSGAHSETANSSMVVGQDDTILRAGRLVSAISLDEATSRLDALISTFVPSRSTSDSWYNEFVRYNETHAEYVDTNFKNFTALLYARTALPPATKRVLSWYHPCLSWYHPCLLTSSTSVRINFVTYATPIVSGQSKPRLQVEDLLILLQVATLNSWKISSPTYTTGRKRSCFSGLVYGFNAREADDLWMFLEWQLTLWTGTAITTFAVLSGGGVRT